MILHTVCSMLHAEAFNAKTMWSIFKMIGTAGMPRLRVLVLTSPPWGIYNEDHDIPVHSENKAVRCMQILSLKPIHPYTSTHTHTPIHSDIRTH